MCSQGCTCLGCTVAFGQQLAGLFQLWADMENSSHDDLISSDIEGSTNALSQLKTFLDQDKASTAKIFTPAGHQDIEALTYKCNLVFKAVILLVQKATEKEIPDSEDSNNVDRETSVLGKIFRKPSEKKRAVNAWAKEAGNNDSAEEKSDLLVGPVPNLTSIKTLGIIGYIPWNRDRHEWLKYRVIYCQVQLRWIRKSLLLHVQMGRLTCLANQYGLATNLPHHLITDN